MPGEKLLMVIKKSTSFKALKCVALLDLIVSGTMALGFCNTLAE